MPILKKRKKKLDPKSVIRAGEYVKAKKTLTSKEVAKKVMKAEKAFIKKRNKIRKKY